MITIIFAPPRTGKTCLLTHILHEAAFDSERNKLMRHEILNKNLNGFNLPTVPYMVSANYDCFFKKYGYSPRSTRRINPFRLGFKNDNVETYFNFPYEVIGITEAQKYLNSRKSVNFPDWQSRWYEQHGHQNLDIYLDTQRPMLIDVNIRELATFIEVVSLEKKYDKNGQIRKLIWHIRCIDNSSQFDKYMSSGKQDKSCFIEDVIVANYNVFECYDSQSCKPKFYEGHMDNEILIEYSKPYDNTKDSYIKFLKEFNDELPDGYIKGRKYEKA